MELIIMGVLALASVVSATVGIITYVRETNEIKREEIAVVEAKKALELYLHNELVALKARVKVLEEGK